MILVTECVANLVRSRVKLFQVLMGEGLAIEVGR